MTGHPGFEQLAQYADGTLSAADRTAIDVHLAECPECRDVLVESAAFLASEAPATAAPSSVPPFRPRRWVTGVAAALAAAAALAIAVRIVQPEWAAGVFGRRGDRPELRELVAALATAPTRPTEGRLTGGFAYAPAPSPTRGAGDRDLAPEVRIAAAKLEQSAAQDSSPERQAAVASGYLAVGDIARAIPALKSAAEKLPANAWVRSDLSAALLARGSRQDDDFRQAVAAADAALALDPALTEALFNRALALDRLGSTAEAADAWRRFAERETDPRWLAEARARQSGSPVR